MKPYKAGRPFKYDPSSGGKRPPESPGEYRIKNKNGTTIYIGESCDLNRRMNEHIRSGKFDISAGDTFEYQVADKRSTSRTRREHEQQKIAEHDPLLNRSRGGEGRPAKR